jgi:DNA-binding NtrC family response regulator
MTRHMPDKRNVLLIDCDTAVCEETQKALREAGYGVTTVSTAEAARSVFRDEQQKIDVVLIDVIWSDEIGPFLASELYCIRPDVMFLLYTELAEDLEIFDNTVIRGIVPKDLTKQELSEVLEGAFFKKVLQQ